MTPKKYVEYALWVIVAAFAVWYSYMKFFNQPKLHEYPESEKIAFVRSCMKHATLDQCTCILNGIRKDYTFEQTTDEFAKPQPSLEFRVNSERIAKRCAATND